jgi:hypothetical protein
MGISLGSGLFSTVTKTTKDKTKREAVAATLPPSATRDASGQPVISEADARDFRPQVMQIFMQEEGAYAD